MISQQFAVVILVAALAQSVSPRMSGPAIAVIAGEDAVNIIQQKTAVRTLVEVRDRNNLPLPGVVVTFSLGGQSASFAGGASTLTVTTNAAGQAAVAGLTPTATGAITINAAAVVNGQAIAATITQTNFATIAEAAASGASAGGGGAGTGTAAGGAGGGGLGTGAVIGIAAGGLAVAGGAAVATVASRGEERADDGPDCSIAVTPTSVNVPPEGGTFVLTITISPPDCPADDEHGTWQLGDGPSNRLSFATINPSSGRGSGTVTVTVDPYITQMSIPRNFEFGFACKCGRKDAFGVALPGTTALVKVSQPARATSAQACIPELRQGVSGEARRTELAASEGHFLFNYETGQAQMMVSYEGRVLFDTGCTGPAFGVQLLSYTGRDTAVTVQVLRNCTAGLATSWKYDLTCPR